VDGAEENKMSSKKLFLLINYQFYHNDGGAFFDIAGNDRDQWTGVKAVEPERK
jgi:hypothetical protein